MDGSLVNKIVKKLNYDVNAVDTSDKIKINYNDSGKSCTTA